MTLRYLHFDYSEATDETGCFDCMASVNASALAALHGELALVLAWAHEAWPGGSGPLDEGHAWQYDLQATQERTRQEQLTYEPTTGGFSTTLLGPGSLRHTASLSITGAADFCADFRARFLADEHP